MNLVFSSQTSCLACHRQQDHWRQVEQKHQPWLQQQAAVVAQEQSAMQMQTSKPALTIYGGSSTNRVL
jgi:hypothetical protein